MEAFAAMKINLITHCTNEAGLQQDFEILCGLLREWGHDAMGIQHSASNTTGREADLNIFLEVFAPQFLRWAPRQWIVPNPEWWYPNWDCFLPAIFERVLCKTNDALKVFGPLSKGKTVLTKFESRDHSHEWTRKHLKTGEPFALHVMGKSANKGTDALIRAYSTNGSEPLPIPCAVLTKATPHFQGSEYSMKYVQDNKALFDALWAESVPQLSGREFGSRQELLTLQNTAFLIVQPSRYEGWGHVIHEAYSCGSLVAIPDNPPFNEWYCHPNLRMKSERPEKLRKGVAWHVPPEEIRRVVREASQLVPAQVEDARKQARAQFENERLFFRETLRKLLER